ncbi:MAG: dihydroorotate dehydrogenase electron transfer subunit, partial [Mycobacterium sp.]|nr:dihydroorotate dehydrogenase electron transfer subunit [Mycobacterium sp.]
MKLSLVRVAANEVIMPNTHVITLDSPQLGQASTPGQFVHLRVGDSWDPILRRPMSIFRIRPEGVSLLVRDVGRGSKLIANLRPDEELDCLGPLGRGFELERQPGRLLFVGGGYGAAPLIGLAEAALPRGAEVTLLVGAASAEQVFPVRLLPPQVEYHAATVDGSLGHPGFVTELVPRFLDWADTVYACGPHAMLESLARVCRARPSLKVQLAMEQHMGCAMGVCLGCVTPTVHGFKRVCRDGPVFPADELIWHTTSGVRK